jgi:hypothetical protein
LLQRIPQRFLEVVFGNLQVSRIAGGGVGQDQVGFESLRRYFANPVGATVSGGACFFAGPVI